VRILVTGGAGFIGSHVVEALLGAGHDVAVLDDLSTGREANLDPRVRFHRVDVRDRAAVADVLARERPEVIDHHAAQMSVRVSVADPVFDAEVNLIGLLNLLEEGRKQGVRQVLFASSGGTVYGENQPVPAGEGAATEPVCPYGVAKLASERYLHYYAHVHGLRWIAFRYGNVYGPRQDPRGEAGVIAIFTGQMLRGEPSVINGSGTQTRDYVYAADVARANLLALGSTYCGPLNVGSGVETDVNTLFRRLRAATGATSAEQHGPAKAGEQSRSALDPSRARDVLGWAPEIGLDEGLARTVAYFRSAARQA
jgi:UDP-glucose 4-epimerase